MTGPRPLAVLFVLCAFVGAHVVHALHPLSHVDEASACHDVQLDVESCPSPAADAVDCEEEHASECALCASSPPVAPVELPAALAEVPADPAVVRVRPADAPARGPPASFRSRAPPAV